MTSSSVVISHTSSFDSFTQSDDLPPLPSPIHLSPIDLPSSLDLPSTPIDHRKQRFPSTNLEEDFVNIKWESESVQPDSFCTSFYNAIYPKKLVRWFRGLPRSMRILLISSLFILLLLISIGIVVLIIFLSKPQDDFSYPVDYQTTTFSPIFPRGKIAAMGQFAVPLPLSSMRTLTPSPDSASVFFAFDNIDTLTIIEKKNSGLDMRTVKIEGMKHEGCQDYFPLSFSSTTDSISANLLPWCCTSSLSSFCYAFNAPFSMPNEILVYKSFEVDVLFFTTLKQVGNYCNMTNYRITADQCSWTDHTEQCYGHLVPVQAASSTYRSDSTDNSTLITSVLLNDNSLHVSDGMSINSVYSFTSSSIHLDQLLLQYTSDHSMIGAVGEWGASIARLKDSSLSLLQFVPFLPVSGTLKGAFFDIQSSLTLFHSIDNGRSMWISEYAFSWS